MAPGSWEDLKPRAHKALSEVFGFEAFRGVQEDAVRAALEGRDAFVLMPTGGGKSLCYALPAVVQGGLVVVVSPLIALMQDQVAALQARGIAADFLSSSRSTAERTALLARLDAAAPAAAAAGWGAAAGGGGPLVLLYVTPELLATDSFRQKLLGLHARQALQMLAVDEAHCISSWGHDFRPTYRQLARLRQQLKGLPCMALTATATQQVQQDILSSLRMRNPCLLVSSFNRPNIHYTVTLLDVQQPPAPGAAAAGSGCSAATDVVAAAASRLQHGDADGCDAPGEPDDADLAAYSHLLPLLKPSAGSPKHMTHTAADPHTRQQQEGTATGSQDASAATARAWPGAVAIVYALKRSSVDVLVRRLSREGLAVAGYHAALPDAVRADVLQRWRDGKLQVVVATVAFGMGVDKADIELVVHFNLPRLAFTRCCGDLAGASKQAGRLDLDLWVAACLAGQECGVFLPGEWPRGPGGAAGAQRAALQHTGQAAHGLHPAKGRGQQGSTQAKEGGSQSSGLLHERSSRRQQCSPSCPSGTAGCSCRAACLWLCGRPVHTAGLQKDATTGALWRGLQTKPAATAAAAAAVV
ncbi:P-loop containing nucleoside triphosphate hydrolase protein [Scenedesmus sp. NREL 46B-D3]|nr:P-loop containing nucleoside triphosphate hydrolase protein [Scenedesmus sp. NREL 46B-D3]